MNNSNNNLFHDSAGVPMDSLIEDKLEATLRKVIREENALAKQESASEKHILHGLQELADFLHVSRQTAQRIASARGVLDKATLRVPGQRTICFIADDVIECLRQTTTTYGKYYNQ